MLSVSYEELKRLNHNGTLFDYITSAEVVEIAYKQTQKGKPKHKRPAVRFRENETSNLKAIVDSVKSGQWVPKGYYKFEIHDPKHRIIFAPAYEDKIVHHLVYQVLREFYEPKFIYDSFSCIRGKGNQRAVIRLQQHYKSAVNKWKEVYLVKIDIKKFFHTIPREVLKKVYALDIKCRRTLNLIYAIIYNSPNDVGLPLGCVTSQLSANVLMNVFDQWVKRVLKVSHYLRYADDIFMLLPTKEDACRVLKESKKFIEDNLGLGFAQGKCFIAKLKSYNPHSKLDPLNTQHSRHTNRCLPLVGLGYKIYPQTILMKSLNKKRVLKSLRNYQNDPHLIQNKNSLMAYNSYLKVCNSHNFLKHHFKELDIYDLFLR